MNKIVLPYVESLPERIETLFAIAPIERGQTFVDLGCGDGRIVIEMAKRGLIAYGLEHSEKYVRRAKINVKAAGFDPAHINNADFWQEDLGQFDVIFIYGMEALMDDLAIKLAQEMKSGALFISNGFPLPGWNIFKEEDHIYVYIKD